jgi:predicted transcriptional regulator
MKRINFHLTEGEEKRLDLIAEVTGIRRAELVRRAIDDYVEKKRWEGLTGLHELKERYG